MEAHPGRDDDLADVVDELEEKVTDDGAPGQETPEPTPTEGAKQEPPD